MKIITWNIRGLNNSHKLDIVQNFVREKKSDLLLLQETKMEKERAKKIKSFNEYYLKASSLEGALGGTIMLWKKSYYSSFVLNERKHFMVVRITSINQNYEWYIVNMCAPDVGIM